MKYEDADVALESKIYEFGEFRLEAANLSLFRNSEVVSLAPKACEVLLVLVESDNKIVKKEEILERVWEDTFVEEANLTHHISALRKALCEDKNGKRYIETIPRRGYRFVAPVNTRENDKTEITISERITSRITEQEQIETNELPPPTPEIEKSLLVLPSKETKKILTSRRTRVVASATIAMIAVVGIGFAFYKLANFSAPRSFKAKNIRRLTTTGRVKCAVISPDGKFVIYAEEELDSQQSLRLQHLGSESSALIAAPAAVEFSSLNISPDGNTLYYLNGHGSLFQIPVLGGTPKKIASGLYVSTISVDQIGISPDGKEIAFVRRFEGERSTLFITAADGTNERALVSFEQPNRVGQKLAWSPDGKIVACRIISGGLYNILAVKVADGTFDRILPQDVSLLDNAAWLPNSKSLVINGDSLNLVYYPDGNDTLVVADDGRDLYNGVSITSDGKFITSVKTVQTANIWLMPSNETSRLRQLTTGILNFDGITYLGFMSDGRIVFDSTTPNAFVTAMVDPSGANPKQLIKDSGFPALSPDSRYLVYQKEFEDSAQTGLFLTDLSDGSEQRQTLGMDLWPAFSPDGRWIVFTRYGERVGLWKIPVEGGEARQIFAGIGVCPVVSPDGKTVAVDLISPDRLEQIVLIKFDDGRIIKTFDVPLTPNPNTDKQSLQWTADGRGLYFLSFKDGASNIWRQPIDGSAPVQVTNFTNGRIYNFAYSPDGSQLALSRGTYNSDIVLIENVK